MKNKILTGVNEYYSNKIKEFGSTPKGVDWNSKESQYLRFKQLCSIVNPDSEFTLLDYGCGYGELYFYLCRMFPDNDFSYCGYDISETMISHAKELHLSSGNVRFLNVLPDETFDYTIASGIFNVKLDLANDKEWEEYIIATLNTINSISGKSFSFNALTKYSDPELMRSYLYYADPLWLFDYCKVNFSGNVALLHDYDLYEFTIIVRK